MISNLSTHELLIRLKRAAKHNDPEEVSLFLELLYQRFSNKFCTFAQGKGLSFEDAEEVVNDTFTRIGRSISTYKEDGKGEPWVWKICKNLVIDQLRKKQREKAIPLSILIGKLASDIFASEKWSPIQLSETNEIDQTFEKAWQSISVADQEEIVRREHMPGTKGTKYEIAWTRFCTAFKDFYEETQ